MDMYENLEQPSRIVKDLSQTSELRQVELDYIKECVCPPRPEELVDRIDDIQGGQPPKALDADPRIAELIEPVKDKIPSQYLEAPNDMEQVEQISDLMSETKGLRLEEWKGLSLEQRVELINELEMRIAEIEHRPACPIVAKNLGAITESNGRLQGHMGTHVTNILGMESIEINSELLKSNNPVYYREVLDTVIHEGRHSYQTYNLEHRETHASKGDITNWRTNLNEYGYQNAQLCGFKSYWMQPVEADARKFAEDILTAYQKKK